MAKVTIHADFHSTVQRELIPHWKKVGTAAKTIARGTAPKRTGAFAASIDAVADEAGVLLTAGVPYAHFVEHGTRTQAAQPTLRPALITAAQ